VAEVWGSLDTSIDGRWENPVTVKSQFTGFHRLEQMLWQDNSRSGAPAMCAGLVKNQQQLLTLVSKAQYNPLEMASGATDLINEAGRSKISGEEERYSNTDLPVFAANVEASMKVVTLLQPYLQGKDASLVPLIQQRDAAVDNLLAHFKDGSRNIKAEQTGLLNRHVWVGQETDQPWLRGGSYMVTRKIRMFVENWDRDYLADQENVIGRAKVSGAPLSGGSEFSTPDFAQAGGEGQPVIPADAHIRLASPEHNGGIHILRRGYSFTDGIDPQAGTLLGGLFFIAFMKNPSQFVKLQTALAGDALNEYIHHTGSAVFAVPPGLRPGQHYGDALFS
jgi:Dyp-type peroxidase family